MSYHPFGSVSLHGRAGRSVGACKSLFLFTLATLALSGGTCAFALTPTTTTLAVTSAGSAVTTVPALTVVTLTATVEAGTTPLTVGQVNFCDATAAHCTDIHLLGTAQLTSAGTAVFKFRPGIGSHSYKAVFVGTKTYASSFSGDSALAVAGKLPTTTTIEQSGTFGSYSLTATVARFADAAAASPTGTVSFLDTSNGNEVVGSAALGTGIARLNLLNTPALPAGQNLVSSGSAVIATGDFNGDGIPDLVVLYNDYPDNGSLEVFLGNGDGTFAAASESVTTSTYPGSGIVVADFDGNGTPDLAFCNALSGVITVLLNNGDGTFTAAASPAAGLLPGNIATADFNGDGNADLVAVNADGLTILLGDGHGNFTATAVSLPASSISNKVAVGDFNGDGIPDLAITRDGLTQNAPGSIAVLLGNGDGTFQSAASPVTGTRPSALVVADFNGDGHADLAVLTGSSDIFNNIFSVLLGNGNGTFMAAASLPTDALTDGFVIADFNGDGNADLALVNAGNCSESPCTNGAVALWTGNGDGTFTVTAGAQIQGNDTNEIAAADFNGDGVPDLAVPNLGANTTALLLTQSTQTVTASGISLPANSGTHSIEASYPGDANYESSLSGTTDLITSANVSLSATSLSFGSEPIGDSSVTQVVTLTNTGGAALTLVKIRLAGANATSFSSSNNCGANVAAGTSCVIAVRMVPTVTGAIAANISLSDNLSASPQNIISLSGMGITPPAASLSLSASSLSFGSEASGDSTPPQVVTVTNTSATATLYFKSIMLGGTNASLFSTSNNCEGPRGGYLGGILAPGQSCRIGVRFIANALGPAAAAITLIDNAPDSPQTITLSGTGITPTPASLSLTSTSLSFGNGTVGQSTVTYRVTVTNTSTTAVVYFGSIVVGGTDASSFVSSNTCEGPLGGDLGGTLAPGARCLIAVRFVPKAAGPANATITLIDNAPTSPQTITLTGTGQ